jgi:oligopeptide transport system permease protein
VGRYIARRALWTIPVLFCISLITFVLMHNVPGGPWDSEKNLAPAVLENLNRRYNLDKPAWQQFLLFLSGAVRGDLGVSYSNADHNVSEIIRAGFPITATLGLFGVLIALGAGLTLGTAAALKQNTKIDYAILTFATAGASIPNIVAGILLIIVFSLGLHWFPTGGWIPAVPSGQPRAGQRAGGPPEQLPVSRPHAAVGRGVGEEDSGAVGRPDHRCHAPARRPKTDHDPEGR